MRLVVSESEGGFSADQTVCGVHLGVTPVVTSVDSELIPTGQPAVADR
jgi:hypothetical protein